MKAVAYMSAIPSGIKNAAKADILSSFISGVNAVGDQGVAHVGHYVVPCDVAFIQGWTHAHGKTAPHLTLRQAAIDHQRRTQQRLLIADSNLFNYTAHPNCCNYFRFSFDGVFPTTGVYFDTAPDSARWHKLSAAMGLVIKPWRTSGNHILLCTQRNGGWSMQGHTVVDWVHEATAQIRKYSNRPIVVRAHPGDKNAKTYLSIPGVDWTLSTNKLFAADLVNAHAVVTYNSSPGVAAALEGVPVFVTDPVPTNSQAYSVANTTLADIELPRIFERELWVAKLAMSHWSLDELRSGEAWHHFKQFVQRQ
jgi:hypothetical protein